MISVVVPLFNEAANLDSLYQRLKAAADQWQEAWEVVFVDDGSTDDSLSILHRLKKIDPRVIIENLRETAKAGELSRR